MNILDLMRNVETARNIQGIIALGIGGPFIIFILLIAGAPWWLTLLVAASVIFFITAQVIAIKNLLAMKTTGKEIPTQKSTSRSARQYAGEKVAGHSTASCAQCVAWAKGDNSVYQTYHILKTHSSQQTGDYSQSWYRSQEQENTCTGKAEALISANGR